MKLKVKGLVFVGFAAAVFAQSALAEDTAQDLVDKKTVASKYYVDHTFQTLNNITTVAEVTADSTLWTGETIYPSMAVLKSVKDTVDSIGVQGDDYINVTNNNGTRTVSLDTADLATDSTDITDTTAASTGHPGAQSKLVTAGAVNAYAEATANKLPYNTNDSTETITANSDNNTKFPTAQNVYEFVTGAIDTAGEGYQRKLNATTESTALYIGKYDSTLNSGAGDSTWKQLQAQGASTLPGTTENYVTITESGGVYSIGLASAMVGVDKADITSNTKKLMTGQGVNDYMTDLVWTTTDGTIVSAQTRDDIVPTVKNVYDFVTGYATGNYQPKVADGDAGKVMIGYNTATPGTNPGDPTTYSSNWRQLTVDSTYMNLDTTTGAAITLANVGHAGTDISGATAASAQSGTDKIASAYAVQEYVQSLLNGNVLPAAGEDCQAGANGITSSNGKACALVLAYHDNGVGLKWIPMAQ